MMTFKLKKYSGRFIENAILIFSGILLLNYFFDTDDYFIRVLNEFLILLLSYTVYLKLNNVLKEKEKRPVEFLATLSLYLGFTVIVLSLSGYFSGGIYTLPESAFLKFVFMVLFTALLCFVIYFFTVLKTLAAFKQGKDISGIFKLLLISAVVTAALGTYQDSESWLSVLYKIAFGVTLALMVFVSFKNAWIAFLSKKQKLTVIIICLFLLFLCGISIGSVSEMDLIDKMAFRFTPVIPVFFQLLLFYASVCFVFLFFTALFHLPTASAFDKKAREVTTFTDLSGLLNSVFDKKDLNKSIVSIFAKMVDSERCILVLMDEGIFRVTEISGMTEFQAETLTEKILAVKPRPVDIQLKNIQVFDPLNEIGLPREKVLVVPLMIQNRKKGFLIGMIKDFSEIESDERKIIKSFSEFVVLSLENSRLHEEFVEKERIEKELDVARNVQSRIIPNEYPDIPNLGIAALFIPAYEVGGDYYDFFRIGDNKLGFVIADVSGKGIPAAFMMSELKGVFISLSGVLQDPSELLSKVNDIVSSTFNKKHFVTAVYGVINTDNGEICMARAGHNYPILFTDAGISKIVSKGIGLGLEKTGKFKSYLEPSRLKMKKDDLLILYTDGITEARNVRNEEFGVARLEEIIYKNKEKDAQDIASEIIQEISVFSKDSVQFDDLTLLLFKWNN